MARRISEVAAQRVAAAIEALAVPQAVKETMGWELIPAMIRLPGGIGFGFVLAISIPVPLTLDDQALSMSREPLDSTAPQSEFNTAVAMLYAGAQLQADEQQAASARAANGGGHLIT